jgi:rod shape-determining protein MreC
LDGVFPAGLSIGFVAGVDRPEVGIFQDAKVQPTVDFAKIREVMVILKQNRPDLPTLTKGDSRG